MLALALSGIVLGLTASPAVAEGNFCGHKIAEIDNGGDPMANLNALTRQGIDRNSEVFAKLFGGGPELCVPAGYVQEEGGQQLVEGNLVEFVKVDTRWYHDLGAWIIGKIVKSAAPSILPNVGPSDDRQAPVTKTQVGLKLRAVPGTVGPLPLRVVPDGETVVLHCYVNSEPVDGAFGQTYVWDWVTTADGLSGYMSDGYLATGTNSPVVPAC